jgi:hypothetical protein
VFFVVALCFHGAPLEGAPSRIDPKFQVCAEQVQGTTSDEPDAPVTICRKLFGEAPFVRLPEDRRESGEGEATIYGVVELDISQRPGEESYFIENARLFDRERNTYDLIDSNGKPIDESAKVMIENHLPSNRVHYLIYEATGKLIPSGKNKSLQLTGLRPAILVDGHAIDERFLGSWEGTISKRESEDSWFTNPQYPENFAPVRITFSSPLIPHDNIGVLQHDPRLPDATRFKAMGKIENATSSVMLSTGTCAPALTSYGDHNPLPKRVALSDYSLKMWRFPAMHTLWSKDFHVVFNYPKGLYPSATAMASDHNFRLKDYIATSTRPRDLVFLLHGNPIGQLVVTLKQVQSGGGPCQTGSNGRSNAELEQSGHKQTAKPGQQATRTETCKVASKMEIAALFDRWNASLQTGEPHKVVANYAKESILLPTVSNRPRLTSEEKEDYFHHFLEDEPSGKIDMSYIELGCNTAVDAGLYTFTFAKTGAVVSGRYSYTYRWNGSEWLITSHHSSAMPENE